MSGSHRILVVYDEADLLRVVEMYLRSCNFEVDVFTTPLEALAYFQRNPLLFSLLLTDMRMPQMTGLEFVNHILRIKPDMKVMLMTAYPIDSLEIKTGCP